MRDIRAIEEEFNDWIEERERNLRKLSIYATPENKLRYKAQIEFLDIVRINVLKILKEVKQ